MFCWYFIRVTFKKLKANMRL